MLFLKETLSFFVVLLALPIQVLSCEELFQIETGLNIELVSTQTTFVQDTEVGTFSFYSQKESSKKVELIGYSAIILSLMLFLISSKIKSTTKNKNKKHN